MYSAGFFQGEMSVLRLVTALSGDISEFGRLAVWIIDREADERVGKAFVGVKDDAVDIDPVRCCGERLALAVDSLVSDLSGISHVGVSVENLDCAGMPERLAQDGGSLDWDDQDGGSGCPGVKDGGSG
jgi:hypothetical protein